MIDFLMVLGFVVLSLIGLVSIFILGIFLVHLMACTVKYGDLILGREEESEEKDKESKEESEESKEESEENRNMANKEDLNFKE